MELLAENTWQVIGNNTINASRTAFVDAIFFFSRSSIGDDYVCVAVNLAADKKREETTQKKNTDELTDKRERAAGLHCVCRLRVRALCRSHLRLFLLSSTCVYSSSSFFATASMSPTRTTNFFLCSSKEANQRQTFSLTTTQGKCIPLA